MVDIGSLMYIMSEPKQTKDRIMMTHFVTVEQLEDFRVRVQDHVDKEYGDFLPGNEGPVISYDSITSRSKYVRIVANSNQRMVFGFIELSTGDLLYPAGWKSPTKNFTRGNIFDDKGGLGRIKWTGVW